MIARNSLVFLPFIISACASLKISQDLEASVPRSKKQIAMPLTIALAKTEYHNNQIPFSVVSYKNEIEYIYEYGLFENPIFKSVSNSLSDKPRITLSIVKSGEGGDCFMGGCAIIPTTTTRRFEVSMNVHDRNNNLVFQHKETISAELWGNLSTIVYGINPYGTFSNKGLKLIIQKCLYEFQGSEAFQSLSSQ